MNTREIIPTWFFKKIKNNPNLKANFLKVFDLHDSNFNLEPYFFYAEHSFDSNKESSIQLFLNLFQNLVQKYPIDIIKNPKKIQPLLFDNNIFFTSSSFSYFLELNSLFKKYVQGFSEKEWLSSIFENFPQYLEKIQEKNNKTQLSLSGVILQPFEINFLNPFLSFIQENKAFMLCDFIPKNLIDNFFENLDNHQRFNSIKIYYQKQSLENSLTTQSNYKKQKI